MGFWLGVHDQESPGLLLCEIDRQDTYTMLIRIFQGLNATERGRWIVILQNSD